MQALIFYSEGNLTVLTLVHLQTEIFKKVKNMCMLSVELYDTRTNQDIIIADELIKERLAWPRTLSPNAEFAKDKVPCLSRFST